MELLMETTEQEVFHLVIKLIKIIQIILLKGKIMLPLLKQIKHIETLQTH